MILSQVPSDERIFIDANIFLYSVFGHAVYGKSCNEFLRRVENDEIKAFTSDLALNEVFHKLMIAEIAELEGIETNNAARMIKRQPKIIGELNRVWAEMELICSFGISILNMGAYPEFFRLSKEYMLTAADAAHLAAMESSGIASMASNDRDFQRVPWLKLWQPEM
ncbi:MAG: PIN domain-containing protein [Methanotrichaceae archaeon]|nr:PIN domain-containing protein [Methanotrichaceae archaeon]